VATFFIVHSGVAHIFDQRLRAHGFDPNAVVGAGRTDSWHEHRVDAHRGLGADGDAVACLIVQSSMRMLVPPDLITMSFIAVSMSQ